MLDICVTSVVLYDIKTSRVYTETLQFPCSCSVASLFILLSGQRFVFFGVFTLSCIDSIARQWAVNWEHGVMHISMPGRVPLQHPKPSRSTAMHPYCFDILWIWICTAFNVWYVLQGKISCGQARSGIWRGRELSGHNVPHELENDFVFYNVQSWPYIGCARFQQVTWQCYCPPQSLYMRGKGWHIALRGIFLEPL